MGQFKLNQRDVLLGPAIEAFSEPDVDCVTGENIDKVLQHHQLKVFNLRLRNNKCSDRSMEVKTLALLGIHDRPTDRKTGLKVSFNSNIPIFPHILALIMFLIG